MPRTAGTRQTNFDLDPDLVDDARRVAAEKKTTLTAAVTRFLEKFTGRKPSFSPRKRGRPKKSENS